MIFVIFSRQCATKLITPAEETSPLTIQPRLNFHTPRRIQASGAHACGSVCPSKGAVVRCGRPSALRHPSSLAGQRRLPDHGAAPSRDNCLFLSSLASILAATTLLLAISLRRSIISAERTASLATASPLTFAGSVFGPAPTCHSAPFAFSVWAIAVSLSPRALLPALLRS